MSAHPFFQSENQGRTILCLGGGALRGMAHIGVWKAIQERQIHIDAIVATSIGSIMGAVMASGVAAPALERIAMGIQRSDVLKLNRRALWIGGVNQESLASGPHFRKFLESIIPARHFARLRVPMRVNAVSLSTGLDVWLGSGLNEDVPLLEAVYASCALPVYFPPARLGGDILVDGGVRTALGFDEAFRWGATRVIAVDVGGELVVEDPSTMGTGMMDVRARVASIVGSDERHLRMNSVRHRPILYLRPDVRGIDLFEFARTGELIERGYDAAERAFREALD